MFARLPRTQRSTVTKRTFMTVIKQNERGVKLAFGRYAGTLEPGPRLKVPVYHRVYRVNIADRVQDMQKQSLISRDNVTFYVNSSVQYRVVNAEK